MIERGGDIVIVTGLPRSGTSMLMQMLAAGGMAVLTDGARAADEDNPRGYLEFEPVKRLRRDSSWLDAAQGKAVKIVHALMYDLPRDRRYRVILVMREMGEVLASQRAMLERQGAQPAGTDYAELERTFRAQLQRVQAWLRAQSFIEAIEIEHGAAISDPARVAAQVNAFLGCELDEEAMARAIEPALYRQRG